MSLPAILDLGQLQRVANFLGMGGPPKAQPTVRVGVLGASQVATYAMLWPARRVPNAEVVAVAARDGDRAREYAKQHGIPRSYGSYDELLADPGVDAVYVGLPNGLHGQWARAALEAGKHVLCEKPFTANEEEAREVQALARRRGLLCREAFHYREHPLLAHLHSLLHPHNPPGTPGTRHASQPNARRRRNTDIALHSSGSGTSKSSSSGGEVAEAGDVGVGGAAAAVGTGGPLGRLRSIEVAVLIPKWVFGGANIRWQETLAGGAAMDAGCYCLHAIRWLVGGQPQVEAARAVLAPNSQVVDGSMSGSLRWPLGDPARSGVRASFRASLQHEGLFPVSTIDVRGEGGSLHCSNFIMPVFGHVVRMTTTNNSNNNTGADTDTASAANGSPTATMTKAATTTTTTRVYGSGEGTYFYQLSRFARDVRALQEAADSGEAGTLVAACTALSESDAADSIANMRLLDAVYTAAGLQPRLPSALAAKQLKQQQQAQTQQLQAAKQ